MHSNNQIEHFVTLFDSNFLPMGLCLHASMMEHAEPFRLWIICMDELVEKQLHQLGLPNVSLILLKNIETDALLNVKNGRTRGEYCWTLTPFSPQFVFDLDKNISRVTYLDADLFFFDSPRKLLYEFEQSGKDVLITRHGYAPQYDHSKHNGIFCVQFMTFRRTEGGLKVMRWWQERCLEWCFARYEDGKFGDQKYLDDWPDRFSEEVHVLEKVEETLAPWNVDYLTKRQPHLKCPVFYHFHMLRIISSKRVLLYFGYRVGNGKGFYDRYIKALKATISLLRREGMAIPVRPLSNEKSVYLRMPKHVLLGKLRFATI